MALKGIIFDYSGTLSLGAVQFGESRQLSEALRTAGLADLGVTTPAVFWDQIVNPTWEEGSTSAVGYKEVMARRLVEVFGHEPSAVRGAVSHFVDAYFAASGIEPVWWPLLKTLAADPSTKTIIASDHYAEATDLIRGYLAGIGISAVSAKDVGRQTRGGPFVIATSADIGFHKSTQRFWETVKGVIAPATEEARKPPYRGRLRRKRA